jgi:orotate phosphoribosyltransferase
MTTIGYSTPGEALLKRLRSEALTFGDFTLKSGKPSTYLVDCKRVVLTAKGHRLAGRVLFSAIPDAWHAQAVAGVELGGCPLASAVSMYSELDAVYVRHTRKDHGSKDLVVGARHLAPGTRIAILEDVATTGSSAIQAGRTLQEAGFLVEGVLALVDRIEGAREAITAAGFRFASVYTRSDMLAVEA